MKKTPAAFKLATVSLLTLSILTQSLAFSVASTAVAAEVTQSANTTTTGAAIIQKHYNEINAQIDAGILSSTDGAAQFAEILVANKVTAEDVDNYVLTTSSTADYQKFHATYVAAMSGANSKDISAAQFANILQAAMDGSKSQGLAWAGCGGLAAGVILVVGAVVVGIVALTKTAGADRIKKNYDGYRANRTNDYNSEVAYYNNRKNQISSEITSQQSGISYAQQQIAYYTGVLAASPDAAVRQNAANQIQAYNRDISARNANIATLNAELAQYNDPNYLPRLLAKSVEPNSCY